MAASALNCVASQRIEQLYTPSEPNWQASDAIEAIEAARANIAPVPFFLYDGDAVDLSLVSHRQAGQNYSVAREVATLEACGAPTMSYQYGEAYFFLRQLIDHPWRTHDPAAATLLVVPSTLAHQVKRGSGGAPKRQYCPGLTSMAFVVGAIARTKLWTSRRADHVYSGLDYDFAAAPLLSRTRFTLCLRGDTPTTSRPYDAIRYGSIPLFVSDSIYKVGLPFQCWVPWRLFSLHVREKPFIANAAKALAGATRRITKPAEARMRELLRHFARDVLWRHPRSRVAENVLLAARRTRDRAGSGTLGSGCCPIEDETTTRY